MKILYLMKYCLQGKFRPCFIFPLFALCSESEFKTGLSEIFVKDYVKNYRVGEFKTGRISFKSVKGENKTGRIQSCIQYILLDDFILLH